mgnify:CR=1 FL=1
MVTDMNPIKIIYKTGGCKMTRKDYIKIANVLKECNDRLLIQESYFQEKVLEIFCNMLKADNNNFNSIRFTNHVKGVK